MVAFVFLFTTVNSLYSHVFPLLIKFPSYLSKKKKKIGWLFGKILEIYNYVEHLTSHEILELRLGCCYLNSHEISLGNVNSCILNNINVKS